MKKFMLFSVILGMIFFGNACMADPVEGEEVCIEENSQSICGVYRDAGDVEKKACNNKRPGDPCRAESTEKSSKCVRTIGKDKKSHLSCEAGECQSDSALWLKKVKGKYVNWGRCRKKADLKKGCNCGGCAPDEKCDLYIVTWQAAGYGQTDAYHDDELCKCQKMSCAELYPNNEARRACCDADKDDEWRNDTQGCCPDGQKWIKDDNGDWSCVPETRTVKCRIEFTGSIHCTNGIVNRTEKENPWIVDLGEFGVSEKDCEKEAVAIKQQADLATFAGEYTDTMKAVAYKLCADYENPSQGNVGVSNGTNSGYNMGYDYLAAEKTLNKFVQDAESNRSVWKNAEGKFNTTRLASDITAGVVLGTVGGVVTGVVIKKNQVKKGFEALNCSVGGQKVADWGDEFSVGLQR